MPGVESQHGSELNQEPVQAVPADTKLQAPGSKVELEGCSRLVNKLSLAVFP